MKQLFLLVMIMYLLPCCKSSKPEGKYDFSNVKSISTDGMEPSVSTNYIMKDTVITVPFHDPLRN